MITKTILTTLTFAVIIAFGAGAFALMNDVRPAKGYGAQTHSSSFFKGDDHDDDHDFDDDDD